MPLLALSLLGPFAASLGPTPLPHFRSNKTQALLVYLAVEAVLDRSGGLARTQRRDQLMALLWPRLPHASAQVNLRQTIYQLRQLVPAVSGARGQPVPFLLGDRHTVAIHAEAAIQADVATFTRLLASAPDISSLEQAVSLYRGDFLTDFYLPDSETFEEWAASRRAEFRALVLEALNQLAEYRIQQARLDEAEQIARRQLVIDNLRESAYRQLMIALAGRGDRAEALRQYAICRELLSRELGLSPRDETERLAAAIRAGDLDDMQAAPTTRAAACSHNIPLPATPLIGRHEELEAIVRFLGTPAVRLLTITGEGGIGKTRLALAVALRLAEQLPCLYPDGIYFIPLGSLGDPAHLAPALSAALLPRQRKDNRSPRRQLLDHLQDKRTLLILDNFDHLLNETGLVRDILQEAADVRILVTSRERLRLSGEQTMPLQGLAYDGEGSVPPAAQLFLAAARRLRPDFSLSGDDELHLQHLCELVEGMPLALELAATWVDVLPLSEITAQVAHGLGLLQAQVRDFPERHRSISAVFDASWVQLEREEQAILSALSVFRGGFPRAAAEAVVDASPRALSRLADRSLLRYDPDKDRYVTHELLRQYAATKLESAPAAAVVARDRHMHYYLSLAEQIESQLLTVAQPEWLRRLEADHENIRAALDWASSRNDPETLARLSGALGVFWGIRGHLAEGEKWLATVLALRDQISTPAVAGVLFALGWLAFERGDYPTAKSYYQESHRLMVESGQTGRIAELLGSLSHVAQQQGDFAEASRLVEESLALYQSLDDKAGIATGLNRLGRLAELQGDQVQAVRLLEQSLALRTEIGDERGMASSLNSLAELARYQGDYRHARSLYRRSLAICTRLEDKRCIAGLHHNLGHVALHMGDEPAAANYFRESIQLYHELDNIEGVALCLVGFGRVYAASADQELAVLLLSTATRLLRQHNFVLTVADQAAYEQAIATLRNQTDESTFARAWAEGQTLAVDEAIAQALAGEGAGAAP